MACELPRKKKNYILPLVRKNGLAEEIPYGYKLDPSVIPDIPFKGDILKINAMFSDVVYEVRLK